MAAISTQGSLSWNDCCELGDYLDSIVRPCLKRQHKQKVVHSIVVTVFRINKPEIKKCPFSGCHSYCWDRGISVHRVFLILKLMAFTGLFISHRKITWIRPGRHGPSGKLLEPQMISMHSNFTLHNFRKCGNRE